MVRIATRLGIKRRVPHNQTQDLGSYLSGKDDAGEPDADGAGQ
jgi:hypothetical protein